MVRVRPRPELRDLRVRGRQAGPDGRKRRRHGDGDRRRAQHLPRRPCRRRGRAGVRRPRRTSILIVVLPRGSGRAEPAAQGVREGHDPRGRDGDGGDSATGGRAGAVGRADAVCCCAGAVRGAGGEERGGYQGEGVV